MQYSTALTRWLNFLTRRRSRSARDVFRDLQGQIEIEGENIDDIALLEKSDAFATLGLFEKGARAQFVSSGRLSMLFPPAAVALLSVVGIISAQAFFPVLLMSLGLSVVIRGVHQRSVRSRYHRAIEFHLPMIMERLVMAVQAGLDILPAVKVVLDKKGNGELSAANPPERLLLKAYRLSNSGLAFEDSLNQVASLVESSALRHAFIHLGVAHREGGELTAPLRELSDSTQLYFQESTEEEIAKLPVRATLPLLFTFAGLIITFLAPPMVQLLEFSKKSGVAP